MRKILVHLLLPLILLIGSRTLDAARLLVPQEFEDLQVALDSCGVRDTVLVSQGTYHGQFLLPPHAMTLMSYFELSGDSMDWLNCRLNGDQGGSVLTTAPASGDTVAISGLVIENGRGFLLASRSYSGGVTVHEAVHLDARHLVLRNHTMNGGLARGRAISVSGDGVSGQLANISVYNDSLINGTELVYVGIPGKLDVRNLMIDGSADLGRAVGLHGDPMTVRGLTVSGYDQVQDFYVYLSSPGVMDLADVQIADNSSTGDFIVVIWPDHRPAEIRDVHFVGNQHLADCGSSESNMFYIRGDSLTIDGLVIRNNYEHCQNILQMRSYETTGRVHNLVYENNRVGNGVWPGTTHPSSPRGQHVELLDVSLYDSRFAGNTTELCHDPQSPQTAAVIFGALVDAHQLRDGDTLVVQGCEFTDNLLIDPDDYSVHSRAANNGRAFYVRQHGGVALHVRDCLFERNLQPNHCPESGLSSLGSVFYLWEYNDGQTFNIFEDLVFRDNDDGALFTTYGSQGVMRNIRLEANRRLGIFAGSRSWQVENVLVENQQAQDVEVPTSESWQAALATNCSLNSELNNCTVVNCDLPVLIHPARGTYPATTIRNLVIANCEYEYLETVWNDPEEQIWAQWEYSYLPEEPHTPGPGIVVDTSWPFDPEFAGGFVPHPEGVLVDGGSPDTALNDLEDPENPGFALWPSQGTLRNDIGYTGGPYAGTLEHLIAVRPPVTDRPTALPQAFALHPAYPNPFNPSTTVSYTLARPMQVELSVYNLLGQQVRTLAFGLQDVGEHSVPFTAGELASGVYVVELTAGGHTQTQKVLLLK